MLRLEQIGFRYGTGDSDFELSDINLNLSSGEFVTILGPNGSGKSTLLNLILGDLVPYKGKIFFNDKPYSSHSRKEIAKG